MGPMELAVPQAIAKRKLEVRAQLSVPDMGNAPSRVLLNEDAFVSMLYLERRRAERAQKRFVLILVDVKSTLSGGRNDRTILAFRMHWRRALGKLISWDGIWKIACWA